MFSITVLQTLGCWEFSNKKIQLVTLRPTRGLILNSHACNW